MAAEDRTPIQREPHVCLHEADFVTMSENIAKICRQMDAVHNELLGKVGDVKSVGMKGKVEGLRKQMIAVFVFISILGTAVMAGVVKTLFFH